MPSRRAFLAGSLAALVAPPLLGALHPGVAGAVPATVATDLVNRTGSSVYAYFSAMDPDRGNAWYFLQSDGRTKYYLSDTSTTQTPLGADCNIPVASTTRIAVPHGVGGRLWFSIGQRLQFFYNPGRAPVFPSPNNPSDPNANLDWGFCELTLDNTQLFANISFVDMVSLPIALGLTTSSGGTQSVGGLPAGGLAAICSDLRAQTNTDGFGWSSLIHSSGGTPLRVLSPNLGGVSFNGYFDDYVNRCWSKYASTDLTIDTQYTWGTVKGRVANDQLTFPGVGSFAKPSSSAIFSCSQSPFTTGNDEMGNLSARLAASLNRTTLLDDANQPDGENPANYYKQARTNHYARILHAHTQNGLGYAFPYDDVHASGGTDVEGKVQAGDPNVFTVTVSSPR